MSCISCKDYAKRITNIFKDEELKVKFESLTGLIIFNNLFLCEACEEILISCHKFKQNCTENYEKDLIKYDPIEKSNHEKPSSAILLITEDEMFSIESKDENQLNLDEEHLMEIEENIETINIDPLDQNSTTSKSQPRLRLRYTLKEKLKAIEIAEKSSNRQAAKELSIDESCIRKWRRQKEHIKINENQDACKLRKKKSNFEISTTTVPDIDTFDTIECEIQTAEVEEEIEPKAAAVKEIKTRRAYSSGEKLEVVAFAEVSSNRQAAKVFCIDESCIRKWRNQKEQLIEINRERGTKRKPNLRFPQLEAQLKSFVIKKLEAGFILRPSEIKAESIRIAEELKIENFKGTSSYIFKFMERYHIPSGKKSNVKKILNE
ncbi:hypothetical protein PVAND_016683 [Polypedilum vanderplanki]|uniref:HTH CENPB-type domain-containing protein n=1 Tax=Polypedilum vanderplanki TaxID=319348 RepID=A0A9J6BFU9_POLVA|nr:hypothetical protein PVAND_016683 [Polypedilum vanderplanki]